MAQGDDGKRPRVGGLSLGELSDFTSLLGASEPTTTAIGPAGSTVRIVHHVVGQQPCVSLLTDGLRRLDRDELIVSVPDHVLTKAPAAPAEVLKAITGALDKAPPLQPGALLGARHPAWPRLAGFVVERAAPMTGVDLPAGCLALHALVDQEPAAANVLGPLRVISRRARREAAWPPPSWCDPWRAAVATPTERSVLQSVNTAHVPGVMVALELERSRIVLRMSRAALPLLADLDVREPFALLASLYDGADALLSWEPGDATAHANAGGNPSPRVIAGCFFAVSAGARTDAIGPIEDGFSALLTKESAAKLGAAILRGLPFDLRPANSLALLLQW
jgi:hypothetical protein